MGVGEAGNNLRLANVQLVPFRLDLVDVSNRYGNVRQSPGAMLPLNDHQLRASRRCPFLQNQPNLLFQARQSLLTGLLRRAGDTHPGLSVPAGDFDHSRLEHAGRSGHSLNFCDYLSLFCEDSLHFLSHIHGVLSRFQQQIRKHKDEKRGLLQHEGRRASAF